MTIFKEEETLPFFRCRNHCRSPPARNDLIFLFIFLIVIALLVVAFPFHVNFFVLVYFFASLFPFSPPDNKTTAVASRQILIPIPLIPLLKNEGQILPSCILRNPLHILRGKNLPPHDLSPFSKAPLSASSFNIQLNYIHTDMTRLVSIE